MPDTRDDQERYQRYYRILAAAAVWDVFSLADVKAACADEHPAYVTRVVSDLENGKLVTPLEANPKQFRWSAERDEMLLEQWARTQIYTNRLTRSPLEERPRERLLRLGAENLRTAELLAILIRTGRKGVTALQAGEAITTEYAEKLEQLKDAGRGELAKLSPVVRDTAYCQIMAGIELGRRVSATLADKADRQATIRGSQDAVNYCRRHFARLAVDSRQEEFHIVTLDTKNHILNDHMISRGLLDQTVVHPREVFRPAIKDAAKSIILVHNHPSGDPTPSDKDLALTRRLEESGKLLDIQVLDHIVVAADSALSLREYESLGL
jgi:DNA repair protein RadC